jgi:hypothetical protein
MYTRGTARVPYIPTLASHMQRGRIGPTPARKSKPRLRRQAVDLRLLTLFFFSSLLTLDWPALFRFLCSSNTKFARPHGLFLHTRMLHRKEYQPDTADAFARTGCAARPGERHNPQARHKRGRQRASESEKESESVHIIYSTYVAPTHACMSDSDERLVSPQR